MILCRRSLCLFVVGYVSIAVADVSVSAVGHILGILGHGLGCVGDELLGFVHTVLCVVAASERKQSNNRGKNNR